MRRCGAFDMKMVVSTHPLSVLLSLTFATGEGRFVCMCHWRGEGSEGREGGVDVEENGF